MYAYCTKTSSCCRTPRTPRQVEEGWLGNIFNHSLYIILVYKESSNVVTIVPLTRRVLYHEGWSLSDLYSKVSFGSSGCSFTITDPINRMAETFTRSPTPPWTGKKKNTYTMSPWPQIAIQSSLIIKRSKLPLANIISCREMAVGYYSAYCAGKEYRDIKKHFSIVHDLISIDCNHMLCIFWENMAYRFKMVSTEISTII